MTPTQQPGGSAPVILNGCPHELVVYDHMGQHLLHVIPESGYVFGAEDEYETVDVLGTPHADFPITRILRRTLRFGTKGNRRQRILREQAVPEEHPGVYWVVSAHTACAAPDRSDFLVPGQVVLGPNGRPLGCRGLRDPNRPTMDAPFEFQQMPSPVPLDHPLN